MIGEEPEKPENHERWIISYADFTTLLLATFVVMYAVSSINSSKFQEMAESFSTAFIGHTVSIENSGFSAGEKSPFNYMPSPVHVPLVTREKMLKDLPPALRQEDRTPPPKPLPEDAESPPPPASSDKPEAAPAAPILSQVEPKAPPAAEQDIASRVNNLDKTYSELKKALATLIGTGQVRVSLQSLGVVIDINEVLLFKSGKAALTPPALGLVDEIAGILRGLPYNIQVNGFTDNVRIHNAQFDSNWDLSATRAISVVKRFVAAGIDPALLVGAGFGEYHPIAPNSTAEGMAANRRVSIVVVSPVEGDRPAGRLFGNPQQRDSDPAKAAAAAPARPAP